MFTGINTNKTLKAIWSLKSVKFSPLLAIYRIKAYISQATMKTKPITHWKIITLFTVDEVPPQAIKFTNRELKVIKALMMPMISIAVPNLPVQLNPRNKTAHAKFPG